MKKISDRLNVHIVPIGLEIDRAVLPLRDTGAHKVVLLGDEEPDEIGRFYEKEIRNAIKKKCPSVREVERESWTDWRDLKAIMAKMSEVVRRELDKENETFINISSGAQLTGIAGTMIAMMFECNAYYVQAKDYKRRRIKKPTSEGVEAIYELPRYTIELISDEHLLVMSLIAKYERASPKNLIKELIEASEKLMEKGVINEPLLRTTSEDGAKLSQNAQLGVFRRGYLETLEEDWEYIFKIGKHRGVTYALTEEGENVLKIFKKANPLILEN